MSQILGRDVMCFIIFQAHCRAFMVGNFHEYVEATPASPPVKLVLRQLVQLYAVHWLLLRAGDFLRVCFYLNYLNKAACNAKTRIFVYILKLN